MGIEMATSLIAALVGGFVATALAGAYSWRLVHADIERVYERLGVDRPAADSGPTAAIACRMILNRVRFRHAILEISDDRCRLRTGDGSFDLPALGSGRWDKRRSRLWAVILRLTSDRLTNDEVPATALRIGVPKSADTEVKNWWV